jgi:hypothetical protein
MARLYGEGSTRGKPYLMGDSEVAGRKKALSLLALGGRWGCDGLNKVLYEGGEMPEFVGGVRQWTFHPGTLSTGPGDPVQGLPDYFPEIGYPLSGYSYWEGLLPPGKEDPGKLEFFMRGLRTMTYETDSRGNLKEIEPTFNRSPAWAGLDLCFEVGNYSKLRINRWAGSWIDLDLVAAEPLAWDKKNADGTPNVIMVPRYDIHVPFGELIDVTTAFSALMMRCPGASFADLQGAIRIYPTPDRESIHRFVFDPSQFEVMSNIVKGSFSGTPRDPSLLPNIWFFDYNDYEDDAWAKKTIAIERESLRKAAGGQWIQAGPFPLGLMYESLAQRIGETMVTLACDPPYTTQFDLKGQADSYPVGKASYVWLSHPLANATLDDQLLVRVNREIFEPRRGEKSYTVGVMNPARDYYKDSYHGPKQNPDAPVAP